MYIDYNNELVQIEDKILTFLRGVRKKEKEREEKEREEKERGERERGERKRGERERRKREEKEREKGGKRTAYFFLDVIDVLLGYNRLEGVMLGKSEEKRKRRERKKEKKKKPWAKFCDNP